ncbi:unnamed protein product [Camellia sinensis]
MLIEGLSILVGIQSSYASQTTRSFQFNLEWTEVSRLCHRKPHLTVNGKYPGPTIAVHEGDNVVVKVTNLAARNTTIHWAWNKAAKNRMGWSRMHNTVPNQRRAVSYSYNFTVIGQSGTLWWHAHHAWQRASVYGAFIIYPRMPYLFSVPIQADFPIIFGE